MRKKYIDFDNPVHLNQLIDELREEKQELVEAIALLQSSLPDLPYLIGALKRAGMAQEDLMKVMEAVGRMDEVLTKVKGGTK